MTTGHPPTVEHLAARIRADTIPRHDVHLITFTTDAHSSVDLDLTPVDGATLTEYGLPVILHAFAFGFADHTTSARYDDVVGYGVAVDGRIYIADRHGSAVLPVYAVPRGDDGDILTGLRAMVDSGPGHHTLRLPPDPVPAPQPRKHRPRR